MSSNSVSHIPPEFSVLRIQKKILYKFKSTLTAKKKFKFALELKENSKQLANKIPEFFFQTNEVHQKAWIRLRKNLKSL